MRKLELLQALRQRAMVAIIRADGPDSALQLAEACIAGGMRALEVALTTPGACEAIRTLRARHGDALLLGAGTVLDVHSAHAAIMAGAQMIISPSSDTATIALCGRYQVLSVPGALTPTEVVMALQAGADVVKLFPAEVFGPSYLKALRAPLPQAPLMPTGGVTVDNLADWFAHGACAVGIGSSLTGPGAAGDYAAVRTRAREFVARLDAIGAARP